MAAFPRTYSVVRGGWAETVTVPDLQTLQELRTELELLLHVGAGADDTLLSALDARIGQLRNAKGAAPPTKLADVSDWRQLLADALVPVNAMTAACIDADFPDIKGTLNMSAINEQNKQFHDDVAAEVRSSGIADAAILAEAFAHATSELDQEQEPEAELGMSSDTEAVADNDENDAAEPAGPTLIEEALEAASTMLDDADDLLTQIGNTADTDADADADADEQAKLSGDEDGAADKEQAAASDEDFQEIAAGLTQAADDLAQLSSAVEQAGGGSEMEETLGLPALNTEEVDAETVAHEALSGCEVTPEETPEETAHSSIEEIPEMLAEAASPVEEETAEPMNVDAADEAVVGFEASSALDEAADDAETEAGDRAAFKKLFESASTADETPPAPALREDVAACGEQTPMSVPTDSNAPDVASTMTADPSDEAERMAEELGKAVATAVLGSNVPAESAATLPPLPFVAFSACSSEESNASIGVFHGQLNEIKLNLVAQIDRLGTVLEGAAQAQVRAEQTLSQAEAIKRAAMQIFDAASQFGEAQQQAQAAQTACEQAAERVARARLAWEVAQQRAGETTRGSEHPGQD